MADRTAFFYGGDSGILLPSSAIHFELTVAHRHLDGPRHSLSGYLRQPEPRTLAAETDHCSAGDPGISPPPPRQISIISSHRPPDRLLCPRVRCEWAHPRRHLPVGYF